MSYFVFFDVYLYVRRSGSITSVGEARGNLSAVFTCNYVVSVRRDFLFLWVLEMGYVILLWHALSLQYNHYAFQQFTHNKRLCRINKTM